MNFNKAIDNLLHPGLKADKTVQAKSRIYTLIFLIILGFSLSYSIFFFTRGEYVGLKAFHNYLGIMLSIVCLVIIRYTGKTRMALFIGTLIGYYLILSSIVLSGGIYSHDIMWFTVLSAASFMFIGVRNAFVITLLSILAIIFFYLVEGRDWIVFNQNSVSLSMTYKFVNSLLMLIVLSLMVYVLVRGNQKLQDALQLTKEQSMREEIARDFHDQIGNKLASLRHLSELGKMNKSQEEREVILSKIDHNAKDVYDNFRDFIWTLDVKSDYAQELFMYLRDFADDYFKYSDVKLYINSQPLEMPNVILPSYVSKEIVPLFKEAITNIQKHADAITVKLDFILQDGALIIKLSDDGKGFDQTVIKSGKGLQNIKHRARRSGGNLEIKSAPQSGTEITYTTILPAKGS